MCETNRTSSIADTVLTTPVSVHALHKECAERPPPIVGTFPLHSVGQEVNPPKSNSIVLTQAKFLSVGPNMFVCKHGHIYGISSLENIFKMDMP